RVLALVRVTELAPPPPRRRRGLQSLHEVGRRLDGPWIGIEIEADLERLTALEASGLAVAAAQWNARWTSHRGDRAAVRVAVQRHLHRRTHFAEDLFRIEGQRNKAYRPVPNDCRLEGLGRHVISRDRAASETAHE